MKTKKIVLLITMLCFFSINIKSQTVSIWPDSEQEDVCPDQEYIYSANDYDFQYPNLITGYSWECVHGDIIGSSIGRMVTIKWDNTTNLGYLKLIVVYDNQNYSAQDWYNILSIEGLKPNGLSFGYGYTSKNIEFCNTNKINIYLDDFLFPNAQHNLRVEDFDWIIPEGWKYNNQVSDGSPIRQSEGYGGIEVYPDGTNGGIIKVRGVNTNCNNEYYSSWSDNITASRVWPYINYNISGENDLICNNTDPVTYTVENISCANYNWSYPDGWSSNGSHTNQIILYPDGRTEGNVSVTATIGSQSKNYNPLNIEFHTIDDDNPPYITGQNVFCTTSTYYIHNVPTGQGIIWERSSGIKITGTPTSNSVNVMKLRDGHAWLRATITSECDNSYTTDYKTFWVGRPGTPITNPPGYPTFEMQYGSVQCISVVDNQGATGDDYNWTITGSIVEISQSGNGCTVDAIDLGIGNFYVITSNICGNSPSGGGTVNVSNSGGGLPVPKSILIYPNPVKDFFTIQLTDELTKNAFSSSINEVFLYDKTMQILKHKRFTGNMVKINVNDLNPDLYILRLKIGKDIYEGKIIVSRIK